MGNSAPSQPRSPFAASVLPNSSANHIQPCWGGHCWLLLVQRHQQRLSSSGGHSGHCSVLWRHGPADADIALHKQPVSRLGAPDGGRLAAVAAAAARPRPVLAGGGGPPWLPGQGQEMAASGASGSSARTTSRLWQAWVSESMRGCTISLPAVALNRPGAAHRCPCSRALPPWSCTSLPPHPALPSLQALP